MYRKLLENFFYLWLSQQKVATQFLSLNGLAAVLALCVLQLWKE